MAERKLLVSSEDLSIDRIRDALSREGFDVMEVEDARGGTELLVLSEETGREFLRDRVQELERMLREVQDLDVAKTQFMANVSHELRTPLTAIVTYGEVLRDGLLGDVTSRQHEAIQSIISSSRQLLSMIEEILTYARTNARAIEIEPTEFALPDVVRDVFQMNASLIRQKGLRYEEDFEASLPAARADRDKILHVLSNLLGNAIEFTSSGGLIRIGARPSSRKVGWIEMRVEDTGIGIDAAYHEMIFREFAQVDSSRSRRHHGTGLGLAIARNYIQLHGGEIWVESELGSGSTFYFTVPSTGVEQRVSAA